MTNINNNSGTSLLGEDTGGVHRVVQGGENKGGESSTRCGRLRVCHGVQITGAFSRGHHTFFSIVHKMSCDKLNFVMKSLYDMTRSMRVSKVNATPTDISCESRREFAGFSQSQHIVKARKRHRAVETAAGGGLGPGIAVLVPFLGRLPFGAGGLVPDQANGVHPAIPGAVWVLFFSRLTFQLKKPSWARLLSD